MVRTYHPTGRTPGRPGHDCGEAVHRLRRQLRGLGLWRHRYYNYDEAQLQSVLADTAADIVGASVGTVSAAAGTISGTVSAAGTVSGTVSAAAGSVSATTGTAAPAPAASRSRLRGRPRPRIGKTMRRTHIATHGIDELSDMAETDDEEMRELQAHDDAAANKNTEHKTNTTNTHKQIHKQQTIITN